MPSGNIVSTVSSNAERIYFMGNDMVSYHPFQRFFNFTRCHPVSKKRANHNPSAIWGLYPLNEKDYSPHNEFCQGGVIVITFDRLWKTMEEKGFSTYTLREKCGIDSKTVRRLHHNENIETKTLDKLCAALDCRLEDIAEFIKE